MMDFLRGLAPHHGNDATRAVPAVPSRFESDPLLRAVPPRTQRRDVDEERETTGTSRITPPRTSPELEPIRSEASLQEPVAVRPAAGATPPATVGAAIETSRPAKASDSPRARPPAETGVLPSSATAVARHQYWMRPDAAELTATARSAAEPHRERADRGMEPPAVAPAVSPRHATALPEAPLSRQRVEAHVEQRAGRRTVVHVTIDRIDVSAPSTPDRTKPPARSRRVTPSQPLTEYLRARHPGQRGDAS